MRTRRGAVILGLAATLALSGTALGAPATETITISGAAGGYADITLAKKAHFEWRDAQISGTGGGKYVGFCMQPWRLSDRVHPTPCGARLNKVDKSFWITAGIWSDLAPGKYRVYLLSDGPATVTFPMQGLGRHLHLKAAGRTPRAKLALTDAAGPANLEVGRWRQHIVFKDNGAHWTGWHFESDTPARVQAVDMCVAPRGGECLYSVNTFGDGRSNNFSGTVIGGAGGMNIAFGTGPDHDRIYQGTYDVILTTAAPMVDTRAEGFSLDIDFSPGPPST
jgi:hypothetical protein